MAALPSPLCSHVFLKVYCVSNLNDTCIPPSDLCVDKLNSTARSVNVCVCGLTDSAKKKLSRKVITKHSSAPNPALDVIKH